MSTADDARTSDRDALPGGESGPHGLRWWLRVAEVRFRFIALMLAALLVVSQWGRLRNLWDHVWYGLRAAPAAAMSGDTEFFCPMDPGVISVWPAICPICNMDLVQRKKHDSQLLPEGVLARMQLSPYRVQLAGIRTSEVQPRALHYEVRVAGMLSAVKSASQDGAVGFEAVISRDDRALLGAPREAIVSLTSDPATAAAGLAELVAPSTFSVPLDDAGIADLPIANQDGTRSVPATLAGDAGMADVPSVRVTLTGADAASAFTVGASVRAVVRIPVPGMEPIPSAPIGGADTASINSASTRPSAPGPGTILAIPESAVVDHGHQRLVFVESMPGMFDAVLVTLGRRCGDSYPVLSGLKPGQRVATTGAFLIDAETRLNPSLAVAYFGANQSAAQSRIPEVRVASKKADAATRLSPEQAALARRQGVCPVTDLPLDSMGGPVPVVVEGRTVFICCKGCEGKLKGDPARYLAKLPAP